MKKVLVVGGMVKGGGISQYIYRTYSQQVLVNNIQVNIVIEGGKNDYINEFEKNNWNAIYVTPIRKSFFKYIKDWTFLLYKNRGKFSAIHFHYDSLAKPYAILLAKIMGYKNIIIHSHSSYNDRVMKSFFGGISHKIGRSIINKLNFNYVSCSDKASNWFFNSENIKNKVKIAKNGIETNEFKFDLKKRKKIRDELIIDKESIIYGHIGRFDQAKNHRFVIDIFNKIQKIQPNSKLLLVGIGPEKEYIENIVESLKLNNNVYFLGLRSDVSDILQAIDIMIFPSKYEGLPLTIIEAQTSGITCFLSDTITRELVATNKIYYISLNEPSDKWAKFIVEESKEYSENERFKAHRQVIKSGFDIHDSANGILNLYK